MDNIWKQVKTLYPDIESVLDKLYKKQLDLLSCIEELESKYPVDGYAWECDPNNIGMDFNPWYLRPKKIIEEQINKADKQLKKQLVCVEGKHHFKVIGDIQWCQYCGTIKLGNKFIYPEQPHFLPK